MNTNEVLLITGGSGSGKTSLIATAAEWLFAGFWCKRCSTRGTTDSEKCPKCELGTSGPVKWWERKILRLYSVDGGAYGTKVDALVQLGIMEVWKLRTRVAAGGGEGLIEETLACASDGYWPTALNPATGECEPGTKLVPPISTIFTLSCSKGHEVKRGVSERALSPTLCSICKETVGLQNGKVSKVSAPDPDFERVGGVAMDGISSMSDWVMDSLAERQGRNELGGERGAINPIRSGTMVFGSSARAHYGFAQTQARKWMHRMSTIPNLKIPVIVTGLESRSEGDSPTALPFYGPQIAGQAMTGKVPQWVGNYLGTQVVIDEKGRKEWRLYLADYRGEDGVPHLYKTRAEHAGLLPEYLADAQGAEPFTSFSLGTFFDLLEGITVKSMEKTKERFPDAPGLRKPVASVQVDTAAPMVAAPTSPSPLPPRQPLPVARPASKPPIPVATIRK